MPHSERLLARPQTLAQLLKWSTEVRGTVESDPTVTHDLKAFVLTEISYTSARHLSASQNLDGWGVLRSTRAEPQETCRKGV